MNGSNAPAAKEADPVRQLPAPGRDGFDNHGRDGFDNHGQAANRGAMPSGAVPTTALRRRQGVAGRTTRLLLVEDDQTLGELVSRLLEQAGFTVYMTALGADAVDLARAYRFDVALLDLTLPDMPGQQVLQQLNLVRPQMPVIILSGETSVETKVENILDGADDYITKPFHRDELLARIQAVLRRSQSSSPAEIDLGGLVIDLVSHRALVNGRVVPLTGKEYACLEFLAGRRGMTATKEMFLAHLYGGRDEPEMKIIDVFICKLRRKLAEAGAPPLIETVWGRGYTIPNDG